MRGHIVQIAGRSGAAHSALVPSSPPDVLAGQPATPGPTAPLPRGAMTPRLRQSLVVVLAVVSGATDAIGVLVLGGAFTSVMTGNLVLLGVAASSADVRLAAASGLAVLAFCGGAALGARVAGTSSAGDRLWPRPVTRALLVELALMTAYAVGWWVSGSRPGGVPGTALLLCTAVALGVQSSAVQRFGVAGLSTTYLTGTLTTVVVRLASGHGFREVRHSVEVIAGLVAGAAAGAALCLFARPATPVLQVGLLAAVVVLAEVTVRRGRPSTAGRP
jgi:uncharacterized membrane protein YoaK (UPF0700 family)